MKDPNIQTKLPIIRGIIKCRNEEHIIKDTLDRWSEFCTGGIYIYDDVSTDGTVGICKAHPNVKEVIEGDLWDPDREKAEWMNRQTILTRAQQDSETDDWFVYFDADEHPYNFTQYELFYSENVSAIAMRLYDVYITKEDEHETYNKRKWVGPEYRTIIFFFKNSQHLKYSLPDQREVTLGPVVEIPIHGDIKHWSKGFSVDEWEKTCDYYIRHWPKYSDKWRMRKGKAVKEDMRSDFGNPLILWKDRDKGFTLEDKNYGKN